MANTSIVKCNGEYVVDCKGEFFQVEFIVIENDGLYSPTITPYILNKWGYFETCNTYAIKKASELMKVDGGKANNG